MDAVAGDDSAPSSEHVAVDDVVAHLHVVAERELDELEALEVAPHPAEDMPGQEPEPDPGGCSRRGLLSNIPEPEGRLARANYSVSISA